jgi:hypothetical protein
MKVGLRSRTSEVNQTNGWLGKTDSTSIHVGSIGMRGAITRKHGILLYFLSAYHLRNEVNSGWIFD